MREGEIGIDKLIEENNKYIEITDLGELECYLNIRIIIYTDSLLNLI